MSSLADNSTIKLRGWSTCRTGNATSLLHSIVDSCGIFRLLQSLSHKKRVHIRRHLPTERWHSGSNIITADLQANENHPFQSQNPTVTVSRSRS